MMASKTSSTLPAQDDQSVTGGCLASDSSFYLVQSFLGQGTFGKVVKCLRMTDMKTVAIKMIKIHGSNVKQTNEEVDVLLKLKSLDSDKCNLVRWYQVFRDTGHVCLEFEHLDKSLSDFMKERGFKPLLLKQIRPIILQLANALDHLKASGIIHADLKLENVMLVDHLQAPYRVKVIDFGLACDVSAAKRGSYIQTRPYRSPEIILGLPFTEAIDMWSLGCMAATLYLGTLLYPGMSQYDMMRYIVETQGQPPDKLLSFGCFTGCFFERDYKSTTSVWKLKTPGKIHRELGIQPMETRKIKLKSLDDLLRIQVIDTQNAADMVAELIDLLMFVDMLKGMLQLDAAIRFTPRQVLEHPFASMGHLVCMQHLSEHVRSCFNMVDFCQNEIPTSDTGKAVCGSQQKPPSSAASPIQQNPPPHAEGNSVVQPDCINPLPCTSTQTRGSDRSGMKRKVDDEDGNINDTGPQNTKSRRYERSHDDGKSQKSSAGPSSSRTQSCVSARVKRKMAHSEDSDSDPCKRPHHKRKRGRKCHAGRSARGRSRDSTHAPPVQCGQRSSPAEHHHHSARPSSSTQTKSDACSNLKRKASDDEDMQLRKRTSDPCLTHKRKRSCIVFRGGKEKKRRVDMY